MGPSVEFYAHHQGDLTDAELASLQRVLPLLSESLSKRWPHSVLSALDELEVSLVDDETLANVHGQFLDDPSPTDVITFPHGEILISVDMARKRAGEFGKDVFGETLLYVIHGLLHLAGFDDRCDVERADMAVLQEAIWKDWMTELM